MTGSQVIDAEEDRHKLVVEYKDALQPADFYHNFKQLGIRSVQLIPHLEFDDRGDLTAASVTAELWGKFLIALFECWVRADISRISIELFDATLQNIGSGVLASLSAMLPQTGQGSLGLLMTLMGLLIVLCWLPLATRMSHQGQPV